MLQEKQKKDAAAGKTIKQSAGELRLQKGGDSIRKSSSCLHGLDQAHSHSLNSCGPADMSELNLTKGTSINFPEGKDKLMHFEIRIKPEDGTYKSVFDSLFKLLCTSW